MADAGDTARPPSAVIAATAAATAAATSLRLRRAWSDLGQHAHQRREREHHHQQREGVGRHAGGRARRAEHGGVQPRSEGEGEGRHRAEDERASPRVAPPLPTPQQVGDKGDGHQDEGNGAREERRHLDGVTGPVVGVRAGLQREEEGRAGERVQQPAGRGHRTRPRAARSGVRGVTDEECAIARLPQWWWPPAPEPGGAWSMVVRSRVCEDPLPCRTRCPPSRATTKVTEPSTVACARRSPLPSEPPAGDRGVREPAS